MLTTQKPSSHRKTNIQTALVELGTTVLRVLQAAKFARFPGISVFCVQNLALACEKGTNIAYFGRVQAAVDN